MKKTSATKSITVHEAFRMEEAFKNIFWYLSSHLPDPTSSQQNEIQGTRVILLLNGAKEEWFRFMEVNFAMWSDRVCSPLHITIDYEPLLSSAGTWVEPSASDFFERVIQSADNVLHKVKSLESNLQLLRYEFHSFII